MKKIKKKKFSVKSFISMGEIKKKKSKKNIYIQNQFV